MLAFRENENAGSALRLVDSACNGPGSPPGLLRGLDTFADWKRHRRNGVDWARLPGRVPRPSLSCATDSGTLARPGPSRPRDLGIRNRSGRFFSSPASRGDVHAAPGDPQRVAFPAGIGPGTGGHSRKVHPGCSHLRQRNPLELAGHPWREIAGHPLPRNHPGGWGSI